MNMLDFDTLLGYVFFWRKTTVAAVLGPLVRAMDQLSEIEDRMNQKERVINDQMLTLHTQKDIATAERTKAQALREKLEALVN